MYSCKTLVIGAFALVLAVGAPARAANPKETDGAGVVKGKVVEKLEGGGYTYLNVEQAGGKVWCAVPTASISVGQQVEVDAQALMGAFESKTLKRKFDRIYFGTIRASGAPSIAAAAGMKGAHGKDPHAGIPGAPPAAAPSAPAGGVAKIRGTAKEVLHAAGYTYLRLATPDGETWAAVPKADIAVGQSVGIASPSNMDGFESKTLKRRFDKIVFGTLAADAPPAGR